jgi:hypothetical protein
VQTLRVTISLALVALTLGACAPSGAASGSAGPSSTGALATGVGPAALVIRYEESSQFELTLPSGRRVYIDVYDDSLLGKQPSANDILLTTVLYAHHYHSGFAGGFPGRKLVATAGEIRLDDLHVVSFDASGTGQPVDHQNPTDQMVLIEAAGLRLLACGDEDQEALTAEQVAAMGGPIDIAICPLQNTYGDEDPTGRKALNVIDQIKPKLLLPTHVIMDEARKAVAEWAATYADKAQIAVTVGSLPATTTMLLLGDHAKDYGTMLKLTPTTSW